jgi:hypothetical protein
MARCGRSVRTGCREGLEDIRGGDVGVCFLGWGVNTSYERFVYSNNLFSSLYFIPRKSDR